MSQRIAWETATDVSIDSTAFIFRVRQSQLFTTRHGVTSQKSQVILLQDHLLTGAMTDTSVEYMNRILHFNYGTFNFYDIGNLSCTASYLYCVCVCLWMSCVCVCVCVCVCMFCSLQKFNPLKTKPICFIYGLSAYRAVNTLHFGYKNQSLNVL
jgi:hypothetical protein